MTENCLKSVNAIVNSCVLALVLLPRDGYGQQLTTSFVERCAVQVEAERYDVTLERAREHLPLREFNKKAFDALDDLKAKLKDPPCRLPDDKGHQYRLIWIGTNQKGEEQLLHVMERKSGDGFLSQRVRGAWTSEPRLIDVFISSSARTRMSVEVGSTPTANPDAAKLSELLERAKLTEAVAFGLGNLGSAGAFAQGIARAERTEGTLWVHILEPNLPVGRANLELRQTANVGFPQKDAVEEFSKLVQASIDGMPSASTPYKLCATDMNAALSNELALLSGDYDSSCQDDPNEGSLCNALLKAEAESRIAKVAAPASCTGTTTVPNSMIQLYRLSMLPRSVTTTAKLSNVPVTRVSFSALSAVLGRPRFPAGSVRVKESNGTIAVDNLSRFLTAVVINYHPLGYEPSERTRPTWRESLRLFAGPTINPEPGLAAGIAFGVARNLALAIGGTVLAFDALREDSEIGLKPNNTRDPFQTEYLRAGFMGLQLKF